MKLQGTMQINDQGHLEIGGCDTVDLAATFGTPLMIIDEALLREKCREYYQAFTQNGGGQVFYASKALLTTALARIIEDEGLGLDVVSGGELTIALAAGFPPQGMLMHGNNKSPAELKMALNCGVGRIVIDNYNELELLEQISADRGYHPSVLLRLTPGVDAHSHAYISTGQIDSKFGFNVFGGEALRAVEGVLKSPHLQLQGVHCHIGSQVSDLNAFRCAAQVMMDFLQDARQETGWTAEELDLGGGLGVYYSSGDIPPSIEKYAEVIKEAVAEKCDEYDFPRPRLSVEPGRSIISPPGTTLYTIGSSKEIPGVRRYVAVDGGMTDNPRPALYQAIYEGIIANKADDCVQEEVAITGRCCESGDMLIWDLAVPAIEPGDLLAVSCTGAYNYSMSSNYNALRRPAVVLVSDGHADVIVKRETWGDLIRLHCIPERLY
ncbi:MAG: diaminopimelate decarboxylase [Syntrophaceticus sp.]|nr:diaminopimelate decarboxylase [Syntrophaceticus sp.]MDD4360547.1 diaminopimelate decarboxylase [Syntrophaceticus sp.]MDD4783628.1 diaminopimelate decarboxylase [Syntrophaceticus sp.]HBG21705.1 diaminopimelate decarboxylase [Peptococcaceae bacterium]